MNPSCWRIVEPGRIARGETAPPGALRPDHVRLRVHRVGYCGSDLATFRGINPLVGYPRIPGHEIAATVAAVGAAGSDDAATPTVGSWVTVNPYTACGTCASCRRGRGHACRNNQTLGVQRDGALTAVLDVPRGALMICPGLDPLRLAMVEPLSVGAHAVRRLRIGGSDTVVVLGCGAVGLGVVLAARAKAAHVVAVDVDGRKLELARALGAEVTIDAHDDTALRARLAELCDGEGPDVVVEAVGSPSTYRLAIESVAFTGRVGCIGYAKNDVPITTRMIVQKELDVLGSRNAEHEDFRFVAALLADPAIPVERLVSRSVPFDQAGNAMADWAEAPGEFCKIQIDLDT